jgi:hypothetical protein
VPELNQTILDNLALVIGGLIAVLVLLVLLVIVQNLSLRRATRRYRELVRGEGGGSLSEVLDNHIDRVEHVARRLDELNRLHEFLETRSRGSLQHIGMVRFNPFEDTGSDQSFAIALLDDRRDGIVISSLHGRNVTRIFAKPVQDGGSQHNLSDEEANAIRIAVEGTRAASPA